VDHPFTYNFDMNPKLFRYSHPIDLLVMLFRDRIVLHPKVSCMRAYLSDTSKHVEISGCRVQR
jgi:hypothetical protein